MNKKLETQISDKKLETVAIKVENVSKDFKIPHEKHSTLKQAALNALTPKSYEVFHALSDVSFEVKKGEFLGIIGKNGSGKSTLLKMLAGIYVPDSGKVSITGKFSPFLELGVGFNPELTARENLFLGGSLLGLPKTEIAEKLDEIIRFAELEEFVDMKFKNFSSGMQVRLAFSLAIHAHADILLMDEVLAVGDSNFQAKCLKVFNDYKRQGKTVVLVTHDINVVQKYCDRAILLKKGKIVKSGLAGNVVVEYMKQNMKDEEDRPKDEAVIGGEKTGKIAKILKVEIVDDKGEKIESINTEDSLTVKIDFKVLKKTEKVNIGIGLYEDSGTYVLGCNTQMDKFEVKGNSVNIGLKNIPLLRGDYYIRVVCFGEVEQSYYDFLDRAATFRVFPGAETSQYRGMVNMEHIWK